MTGVKPVTCPPITFETIDLDILKSPLVYLRLHGVDGAGEMYGDDGQGNYPIALTNAQIRQADFRGSIVYLEGCNGDEYAQVFLDAGAKTVIGDIDASYGKSWRIGPSSLIGQEWLRAMHSGLGAHDAMLKAMRQKTIMRLPERLRFGMMIFGEEGAKL